MALLVNGFYDFRMVSPTFVPYLGLGLGGARITAKGGEPTTGAFVDDSTMVFAYQLAAGLGYVVSKEITVDLGYKYFATAKPDFDFTASFGGGKVKAEYASHNVFLGLRYNF
jgi:opacity protein-like surface antigen